MIKVEEGSLQLEGTRTEAFKTATKLQVYVVTKGDAKALLRVLKLL